MENRINNIESLRKTYGPYYGESLSANAVINLCDEVVKLRIALKAMIMATMPHVRTDENIRKAHDLSFMALEGR